VEGLQLAEEEGVGGDILTVLLKKTEDLEDKHMPCKLVLQGWLPSLTENSTSFLTATHFC